MKTYKNKYYTVTQMADISGVSKASISRWLNKQGVDPEYEKGKSKFFKATYVQQYLKAHRSHTSKVDKQLSIVTMLQEQVSQLKTENKRLVSRIEKQDEQLKAKDKQIANWTNQSAIVSKLANDSHLVTEMLLETKTKHVENSDKSSISANESDNHSLKQQDVQHKSWIAKLFGLR